MPFKKEYSWSEVKRLIASSEARASPFTFRLATYAYEDQQAIFAAEQLAYAPKLEAWQEAKQAAVAQRKADVAQWKQQHPGEKPTHFGKLAVPSAPAAPVVPVVPDAADFHGHASSMHHEFSDAQLVARSAQMNIASAFTKAASVDGGLRVKTADQSILIRTMLNSQLGQAALGALDAAPEPARLMITQADALDVNMRVAKGGTATTSSGIKQMKLILDSGASSLHIVTCYPQDSADGGDLFMTDSGYSISTIDARAAKADTSVRWSTQTNAPIT
jgi:hypothetical protein